MPTSPFSPSKCYLSNCIVQSVTKPLTLSSLVYFFYHEDGGDMFLRNVSSYNIHTTPHVSKLNSSSFLVFYEVATSWLIYKPRTWTDSLDKRPKLRNMDMRFGTWNVRSLYRAGSLMTVSRELARYKLGLILGLPSSKDILTNATIPIANCFSFLLFSRHGFRPQCRLLASLNV
jgi:hypothetical protein